MSVSILSEVVTRYYQVQVSDDIIVPTVYMIAFAMSTLLREFTHGTIRYVLVALFGISFATLTFIVMYDYSPISYINIVMVALGIATGMWKGLRKILSDLKRD